MENYTRKGIKLHFNWKLYPFAYSSGRLNRTTAKGFRDPCTTVIRSRNISGSVVGSNHILRIFSPARAPATPTIQTRLFIPRKPWDQRTPAGGILQSVTSWSPPGTRSLFADLQDRCFTIKACRECWSGRPESNWLIHASRARMLNCYHSHYPK